jgi:hypothetical protein
MYQRCRRFWLTANWHERGNIRPFRRGIRRTSDLRRILLPSDFDGPCVEKRLSAARLRALQLELMVTVAEKIRQTDVMDQPLESEMTLSMGPQHPSTHRRAEARP